MFSTSLFVEGALQLPQIHTICQSLVVTRILYALPAWGGLLSAELKGRINAFLRRLHKYGFTHSIIDIEHLLALSDRKLFRNTQSVNIVSVVYSLHARIMILHFDLRVMTFYCLSAVMSHIGLSVLQLYVVFVIC